MTTDFAQKLDTEVSRFRDMKRIGYGWWLLSRILLIGMAPVACFFIMDGPSYLDWKFVMQQYFGLLLAIALPCVFIMTPPFKGAAKDKLPWYDIVLAVAGFGIGIYVFVFYADILLLMGIITPDRVILGTIAIILIIEAVRRLAGWVLAILGIIFILYAFLNWAIPGAFGGKVITWPYLANYLFLDLNGMLGTALSVTALVVLPFVLFGNFLHGVGGGPFLTDMALVLFGRFRGGPAKMAVVASGFFGTISGSAVSNVVGTGVVTIPLMKRTGYKPHVAGAIESVASTGGQLMPPVMGAAAFIIAEFTGIPYAQVVIAALIPAILYYIGIFIQVDLEAGKNGLKGLPREQLPPVRGILMNSYLFVIPLLVLILGLFTLNLEAGKAALLGVASIIIVGLIQTKTRTSGGWFIKSLEQTGRGMLELISIVAMAGFIIGIVQSTGLAFIFPLFLGRLAGGNLYLLLVIIAIAALILGMGMPTVAVYLVLSLLLAPALVKFGVPILAAHLFIMYWGMLSMITPPVCLASFAAAAIAGADSMRTGYSAMRIAILVYIVPFLFVLGPTLLLIGQPIDIAISIVTALFGSALVGIAAVGYLFRDLNALLRVLFGLAGLGLLIPLRQGELYTMAVFGNIIGAILTAALIWWELRARKRLNQSTVM